MAFVADSSRLRTYDPDRGLELFWQGGSSDGTRRFELVGPNGSVSFAAEEEWFDGDASTVLWRVRGVDRLSPWWPLVVEALMAHKRVHGLPADLRYEVL